MNQKELIDLANLLAKFHNTDFGHNGSLYGRNMDRALASDLHSVLHAYGIGGVARDLKGEIIRDDQGEPMMCDQFLRPLIKA